MNNSNIKIQIFNIFELSKILFNAYYNGHYDNYTEEELTKIKHTINSIENKCKIIKEELQ